MATYKICIAGCDDETEFEMELDDNELQAIFRLAEMSHKVSELWLSAGRENRGI